MINSAKEKNIMLATESLQDVAYKKISTCLTLPIDGRLINFFDLVEEKNKHLTPQPMVEKIIAKAEQEMPMYEYHNKPFPINQLWQKRFNQMISPPESSYFSLDTVAKKTIPEQRLNFSDGNSCMLWMTSKSLKR